MPRFKSAGGSDTEADAQSDQLDGERERIQRTTTDTTTETINTTESTTDTTTTRTTSVEDKAAEIISDDSATATLTTRDPGGGASDDATGMSGQDNDGLGTIPTPVEPTTTETKGQGVEEQGFFPSGRTSLVDDLNADQLETLQTEGFDALSEEAVDEIRDEYQAGLDRLGMDSDKVTATLIGNELAFFEGKDIAESDLQRTIAKKLETEFLDDVKGFNADDVRVTETVGDLSLEFTESGEEKQIAKQLGVGLDDIDVEGGNVVATSAAGRRALASYLRPDAPATDSLQQGNTQQGNTQQPETADPYAQIEQDLEADTGVDLDGDDIEFTEIDGRIVGTLSDEGEQTVAAARTPFQNSRISSLLEAGARIDVQMSQFRERNVKKAQEWAGTDLLFGGTERAYSTLEDAMNFGPDDLLGRPAETTDDYPDDLTGGTLPVFSGVGGGGGVGSLRAAAAGTAVGSGTLAGLTSYFDEAPAARASVPVPESGAFLPEQDGTVGATSDVFADEVPIPDPTAVEFFGVPEQGITIDPTAEPTTKTEIGLGGALAPEVDIPDADDADNPFLNTEGTATGVSTGKTTGGGESSGATKRSRKSKKQSVVPESFLPSGEQLIGRDYGGSLEYDRGGMFVGRGYRPDRTLTNVEDLFFGTGDTPELDATERPFSQAKAGANQRPWADVFTSPAVGTGVGVDSATAADSAQGTAPGLGQPTGTAPGLIEFDIPTEYPGLTEYSSPTESPPAYEYLTPTPSGSKRKKKFPFDAGGKGTDLLALDSMEASDVFDNPTLSPEEALEFDPLDE